MNKALCFCVSSRDSVSTVNTRLVFIFLKYQLEHLSCYHASIFCPYRYDGPHQPIIWPVGVLKAALANMAAGIKTLWSLSFSSLLSNVLLILLVLWVPAATEPSLEQFSLDQSLENALVCSPFSRYVLAETFFPKVGEQPICIPVKYTIFDCSNQTCSASTCCNCTSALVYNATFLWTQYNIDNVIGPLLLSFAWSGVVVRGFDWGYNCLVRGGIDLVLRVGQLDWNQSEPLMEDALRGVTAVVGLCSDVLADLRDARMHECQGI